MHENLERQYRVAYTHYCRGVVAHESPSRDKIDRLRDLLGSKVDAIAHEVEHATPGYPTSSRKAN